ncbi:hypothetical protein IEN85_04950 [Pelagicoccus sp. NFK12]|uniref:Putative zinc-ribbon domain-containing protein n=1 Tax=Pelagicoccus enzymogenes TaxID=2773457 RepID=A0A927IGI2_9BACT|nr:hypothetical protein [Pelagicoccus enzymogenes]MBD5778829.1 hypothetical protein [Pelagicoccus enzymogenes]MDQ8197424.1 hypothetical protein [Pelagicoccus enzymogenes]
MPTQPCPECGEALSPKAASCPHCGYPQEDGPKPRAGGWQAASRARTPINVFALAMMACASLFGVSATQIEGHALSAFTYALHIFLAIAGMFFICLLFCRSSIYHPEELARAKKDGLEIPPDRPVLAAILIGVMIIGYSLYQLLSR